MDMLGKQIVESKQTVLCASYQTLVSVPDPNQPQRGSLQEAIRTGVGLGLGPRLTKCTLSVHYRSKCM